MSVVGGPSVGAPARRSGRTDPTLLPDRPVAYHQLLRGPRWRWWRPLLSLLLVVVFVSVASFAVIGVAEALGAAVPAGPIGSLADEMSPISTLELFVLLAVLIPASCAAVAVAHRVRPRWVSSVVGGLRWRWLGCCSLVVAPVWVLYLGIGFLTDDTIEPGRPEQWVLLLVITVVLTPLQAAGEEYLFRGWLVQNLGGFFARPLVGLVVTTVVSAGLFGLAHGSLDVWVLLEIGTLGVAACLANWRTGGLEAGISMHAVNNLGLGILTITYGGYADSFVTETSTGTWDQFAWGVLVHAVAVALILWQGRRVRVQRLTAVASVEPPDATWYAPLGR